MWTDGVKLSRGYLYADVTQAKSKLSNVGQAEFKKMNLVSHFGMFYISSNPDSGLLLRLDLDLNVPSSTESRDQFYPAILMSVFA